ncbi:hypothetical protein FRX31_006644, partial [Thalictrum thalictroides]
TLWNGLKIDKVIDKVKGETYATCGYAQIGPTLLRWYRSYRFKLRKKSETVASCSNLSELDSIYHGALTAQSLELGKYWMRSDSEVGISYARRAFSRFLRTNDLEGSIAPFKVKFRQPIRPLIYIYKANKTFPRLVRIPGLQNKVADCLARNAPKSSRGQLFEYQSYYPPLPDMAQEEW